MGNIGSVWWYTYVTNPDTAPDFKKPPTFDPLYGFPEGRQERTVNATREELDRANVPLKKRDYCVDFYMDLLRCRQENYPRMGKYCSHELHAYEHCQRDDMVLRVKEWERERRLKERARRIACRENAEQLEE